MANFKYAGISETTDAAIIVDGYYYGDDKKFVYADAEAGKKLFIISNLNYEKIGTGLFNKFAGGTIQNLIFKGVKSELNINTSTGELSLSNVVAGNSGTVMPTVFVT